MPLYQSTIGELCYFYCIFKKKNIYKHNHQ